MKNIIIRTLGGGRIGYGHFFRCLSLYKALCKVNPSLKIKFIINDNLVELANREKLNYIISNQLDNDRQVICDLDSDLFILDTYLADNDYIKMIKPKTDIMLIDDNNDIYDSTLVDIIYNGNIHASNLDYLYKQGQLRLIGTQYLIMKQEYWEDGNCSRDKKGILITTGGTDSYGISKGIMDNLKDLDESIKIILGPGNTKEYNLQLEKEKRDNIELIYSPYSLKDYINESRIVITAAGSTIYEILSQNTIPIIFSLADNQDLIVEELKRKGIVYLGKYPKINYLEIKKNICNNKIAYDRVDLFNLVDGKGALRVAEHILLFKPKIV